MGITMGSDGNIYVANNQLWSKGISNIIRINIKDGKPINQEVVASGFAFPNAVAFRGDDLFVTDTVLDAKGAKTISGTYRINIGELDAKNPLKIAKYKDAKNHDKHLFDTYTSNGSMKFGANGLTFDDKGNLYVSIMEDGTILKTTFDKNGDKKETKGFAKGMLAVDGFKFDKKSQKFYMADLYANAIYSIDMQGKIKKLAQNGDTKGENGEIDAPSEVEIRDGKVLIFNFDAVFLDTKMVNKTADEIHTLSVIDTDK